MKIILRYVLLALALALVSFPAQAGTWRPTDAESDAFVRAYAFTVMAALMEEAIALKVEAGKMTPAVGTCLRKKMALGELFVPLRPIVAGSFSSRKNLKQATVFFTSPAGVKLKTFGARQLRVALREASGAAPDPAQGAQFNATQEEAMAAQKFAQSAAGKEFDRFVEAGLPEMGKVDVFGPVAEECVHASAH